MYLFKLYFISYLVISYENFKNWSIDNRSWYFGGNCLEGVEGLGIGTCVVKLAGSPI